MLPPAESVHSRRHYNTRRAGAEPSPEGREGSGTMNSDADTEIDLHPHLQHLIMVGFLLLRCPSWNNTPESRHSVLISTISCFGFGSAL